MFIAILCNLYFVSSVCQGKVYKNEVIWRSWHQGAENLVWIDRHVNKQLKHNSTTPIQDI